MTAESDVVSARSARQSETKKREASQRRRGAWGLLEGDK